MKTARLISTLAATSIITISGLGVKIQNASIQIMPSDAQTATCSTRRQVSFPGKAASTGINIRSAPSLNAATVRVSQPNEPFSFDAWTYGDVVLDLWAGTPDSRWYKLSGQNAWVSSAVVVGNAPHSTPTCPSIISPRLQAFLDTIAYAEGTNNPDGYRTIYGYEKFDSFADHPRRVVCAGGYCSNAAGRYQFLSKTWDGVRTVIGARDFSPLNQDLAAKELIRENSALADVENGNIDSAIYKCNGVWASLPGSPDGQPTRSLQELRNFYQRALAGYS